MTWTHAHDWKLPASPERIFRALTDPAELTQRFAECVAVGSEPGGPYRFWGKHTLGAPCEAESRQTITRFEPGRALGFSWRLFGINTEVNLTLAAEDDATHLTLAHAVDGDLPVPRQRELIDDHWRLAVGNLTSHLAGGSGVLLSDYTDPLPQVRLTITNDAPPEAVFRALIEPERINRWFQSASTVVEPWPGGRYDLNWRYEVDGKEVAGGPTRILEIVPNERLVLDWPDWRGDRTVTGQTIAFYLEPVGDGTKLTLVHAGFGRTADMSDYPFGWTFFLNALKREAEVR